MDVINNILFFSLTLLPFVIADSTLICRREICYDDNAYCCDDGRCCFKTYIYEFWWFWVIWIVIFFLILACSANYFRRRNRTRRLAVMANSQYPTYGTVIRTQTNTRVMNPGATTGPPLSPNAPPNYYAQPPPPSSMGYNPAALPSYADSEANRNEKPPAYSANSA